MVNYSYNIAHGCRFGGQAAIEKINNKYHEILNKAHIQNSLSLQLNSVYVCVCVFACAPAPPPYVTLHLHLLYNLAAQC